MDLPINYHETHFSKRKLVREEYIRRQGGKCHYCGAPLNGESIHNMANKPVTKSLFPKNFFKYPVHLHHSHETGLTIGAVHAYCNAVLWEYEGE